jgi:hypothetical protein
MGFFERVFACNRQSGDFNRLGSIRLHIDSNKSVWNCQNFRSVFMFRRLQASVVRQGS